MKITTVCSLALTFSLHAGNTNSQNVKVTVKQNNTELSSVLNDIEKQTDYLFVYDKYVNVDRKVSVNSNKKPLEEVLKQLFDGTDVKFVVDGSYIILSPNSKLENPIPSVAQQNCLVTGIVKDATGEPVIGANVVEKERQMVLLQMSKGDSPLTLRLITQRWLFRI